MKALTYSGEHLREVRFPLGGIGAGSISLDGSARLVDWEIKNRPNKESYNGFSHLAVKAEKAGEVIAARALNGPWQGSRMGRGLHSFGGYTYGPARETLVGLPHFAQIKLDSHFPFARYSFSGDFPAQVELVAFSPFEPQNDFTSSLPLAFFTVELTNTSADPLDYTVAFSLTNPQQEPSNIFFTEDGLTGLVLGDSRPGPATADWGQLCLLTAGQPSSGQAYWYRGSWFDALNVFWQDFTRPGPLEQRQLEATPGQDHGTICVHLAAGPGQKAKAGFVLAWYYPHYEKYWGREKDNPQKPLLRNWYASQFSDAADLARFGLAEQAKMESAAARFSQILFGSTLPREVVDAASATLAVLKSPTCVRLSDGSFYGWEGSHAREGSCEGSCQHVWNYQYALPLLFPSLERSMRELDYRYNTRPDGSMGFRLQLPPGSPPSDFRACADGQLGGVIKSYRDWQLSGDKAWLRSLWPDIRRSLEFAWNPANPDRWDPDQSGVLTGRQHHTLDMELFGPNSWLTGIYLAALEAAARMADALAEKDFADLCRRIKQKGQAFVRDQLFNGEYYYHKVDLADKTVLDQYSQGPHDKIYASYWNAEAGQLKYQIGQGSSIDQLLGQWHADLVGLGDIFPQDQVLLALAAIYKYNFIPDMSDFFNPCRIYCLEDEGGTLICAYPPGRERPVISAPYAEETMHGFEYAVASHMLLRGLEKEGLELVRAVRDRYDGRTRNPWNEIECGGNYARSMAAWSLVLAYSGFRAELARHRLVFQPMQKVHASIWSAGRAWGQVRQDEKSFQLSLAGGSLELRELQLGQQVRVAGARLNDQDLELNETAGLISFSKTLHLEKEDKLEIIFA